MRRAPRATKTDLQPAEELLVEPDVSGRILPGGRPEPGWRSDLRRIPDVRNAYSVVLLWAFTAATAAVSVAFPNPVVLAGSFFVMGMLHVRYAILMHESAHRLLLSNRKLNDWVGKWLVAYPAFIPIDFYRRAHMAHHREEFGPDEPDLVLYSGYPVPRASLRRKLTRDALGVTGLKLHGGLVRALYNEAPAVRRVAWGIVGVQLGMLTAAVLAGHWWVYPFLWFLPQLTVWRVANRLRGIAEHAGMQSSPDRRRTTHCVRQSLAARLTIVPYHTGFHLAHHLDPGIPFRRLPEYHAELVRSGYIQPGLQYPGYVPLWRVLSSG